jgi:hypothetical protein
MRVGEVSSGGMEFLEEMGNIGCLAEYDPGPGWIHSPDHNCCPQACSCDLDAAQAEVNCSNWWDAQQRRLQLVLPCYYSSPG